MKKVAQKLTLALLTITVCIALLVGGTFALFSQDITVTNHLVAGNIKASLTRERLEKDYLDKDGQIKKADPNTDSMDFTNAQYENLFGLKEGDMVAPGCSYTATMRLTNKGTVAFTYWLEFKLNGEANKLAEQLEVTVTAGGNTTTQPLSAGLTLGSADKGLAVVNASQDNSKYESTDFTVTVKFVSSGDNNAAQSLSVGFDLVVHAIQYAEVQG